MFYWHWHPRDRWSWILLQLLPKCPHPYPSPSPHSVWTKQKDEKVEINWIDQTNEIKAKNDVLKPTQEGWVQCTCVHVDQIFSLSCLVYMIRKIIHNLNNVLTEVLYKGKQVTTLLQATFHSLLTLQLQCNYQGFSATYTEGLNPPRISHWGWKCSVETKITTFMFSLLGKVYTNKVSVGFWYHFVICTTFHQHTVLQLKEQIFFRR